MKKAEREALAHIVADMLYAASSSREMIATGQRIVEALPELAEPVAHYRYPVSFYNVLKQFRSAIRGNADPYLTDPRYQKMDKELYDTLDNILESYLDALPDEEAWLYDVEQRLAEAHSYQVWAIIKDVVHSEAWQQAVVEHVTEESDEYAYLICRQPDL